MDFYTNGESTVDPDFGFEDVYVAPANVFSEPITVPVTTRRLSTAWSSTKLPDFHTDSKKKKNSSTNVTGTSTNVPTILPVQTRFRRVYELHNQRPRLV